MSQIGCNQHTQLSHPLRAIMRCSLESWYMETRSIYEFLQALAEVARSDESIYRVAALDADGLSLIAFSISCATLCHSRAAEIDTLARLYVAAHKPSNTISLHLRRVWIWLKRLFHTRSDRRIIDDCIFHQEASRRVYPRALHLELPGILRPVLQKHMAAIDDCLTGLHHLRKHGRPRIQASGRVPTQQVFTEQTSND